MNTYKVLAGRRMCWWQRIIKMNLENIGCIRVDWIRLASIMSSDKLFWIWWWTFRLHNYGKFCDQLRECKHSEEVSLNRLILPFSFFIIALKYVREVLLPIWLWIRMTCCYAEWTEYWSKLTCGHRYKHLGLCYVLNVYFTTAVFW
jgi:hypothetical protein